MSVPAQAALADAGGDDAAGIFDDLAPTAKKKDTQPSAATDVFRDVVPQAKRADYEAPEAAAPDIAKHFVDHTRQFDTGVMSKLNVPAAPGEAADTVKRAAGGAVGAYNFAASLPGMILAGLSAAPYAVGHAISPDKVPSAGEAMDEESDLLQVHPSGAPGEGEQAATQALSAPFTKAADLAGAFTASASDPHAQPDAGNFQSRFGIPSPATPPANVADTAAAAVTGSDKLKAKVADQVKDAQREAVTRTGGEFAANLLMMLTGGKEGAKAVEGKGEPAPAPEPANQAPPQPPAAPPAQPAPGPDKAATGQNQPVQGISPAAAQVPIAPKAGKAPAAPSGIDPKGELVKALEALKADPTSKVLQDRVAVWQEAVAGAEGSATTAQPAAKSAPAAPKPFLTPQQLNDTAAAAKAQQLGLAPAQAAALKGDLAHTPVDAVTGFNEQRAADREGNNPRLSLIARAQQHAAETGQPAHYVEADIGNLGGLNAKLGASAANSVYKNVAGIFQKALADTGATVVPGRHGGDEFNAVVVGAETPAVKAAIEKAKGQVADYAEKAGLADIPHTKAGRLAGVGLHAGIAEITRGRPVGDVLHEADTELEHNKGAAYVAGEETAENRNQPGAAAGGDTGGAGAPARPGEERPGRQPVGAGGAAEALPGVRDKDGGAAVRQRAADNPKPTEYVDPRLKRDNYRDAFKVLGGEMEEGGGSTGALVGGDFSPLNDTLSRDKESEVRRLKSSNPKWVQRILSTPELSMSVRDVQTVIRKAAAGEPLGVRQVKVAKALLDHLQEERLHGQGGLAAGKARLAQARELRLRANIGDEGFDREPAHRYTEESYDPRMDGLGRTLYELETQARKLDPGNAEAIGERTALGGLTNVEAAKAFQAILDEHGQAQDQPALDAAAQGGQEPAGVARASEGAGGRPERDASGGAQPPARDPAALDLKPSPAPPADERAPKPVQEDMLGGKTDTQQALHDRTLERDAARNSGQESAETGDGGDLFSEARKQGGMKFAKGDEREPGQTKNELRTELQRDLGRSRYDKLEQAGRVTLHDTPETFPGNSGDGASAVYVPGEGMHLAASEIGKGKGLGMILHEATHESRETDDSGGLKSLLGKPFDALDKDFQKLLDAGDKAAVDAHAHAEKYYAPEEVGEERIATLMEEVVKTAPSARAKTFSAKALDLVQRVLGYLRRAVAGTRFAELAKKAGVNLDLQPKDYVALARAALDREPPAEAALEGTPKKAMGVDKPTPEQVEARAKKVKDPGVADKTESASDKLHNLMVAYTPDYMRDFWHGLLDITSPLSNGTEETAAIAKDYANAEATAVTMREDEDKALRKGFTPNERYQMWQATSNESVAKTRGLKLFESNDGFKALPDKLREAALKEQALNDPVADAAVARGIIPHRFKIYDPRFLTGLFKDGEGKDVLNALGHDIRLGTGHAKERLHVTADATEQAAKALYGDQAKLVRDIRIMPYARMRLRRIMAAQDLIRSIESYGQHYGVDTVMPDDQMERPENVGKFFTVDNPAFRKDGKQIWVSKNFEGPLNAVLRGKDAGAVERALTGLKSKAMSTIVGLFPPVHRTTVFFKTVLAAPLSMLTGRLQASGRELRLSNSDEKYALVNAGLRDVSMRGWQGSMDDIDKEATLTDEVGKSWTAKALGMVGKAAGTPVGKSGEWQRAVKETVDAVGDYWHSSIMWERVADTQYGLAQHVKRDLMQKGMSEDGANRVAAQLANRFVGSIAREDMGKGIRTFLNMFLFSRSFTMSNVGLYKDALGEGLPKAIRGKLSDVDKAIGKSYYRKKAAAVLVKDMATYLVLNSAIQSAVAAWTNAETTDEIENGYKRRFADYLEKTKHNPLHALNLQSLTPNSENEPGKEDYIYMGRDAQGTGIYAKNMFGKVGQDLMDWVTSPAMTLKRKESTLSRPVMAVLDNDKGNGQMVYDPQGSWLGDVADVAKYVALQQGPGQTVQGAHDIITGEDRTPVTVGKVLGAPFGVFLSKGAPGGPVAGMVYAMDKEHEYQVQQVMPDAYRYIRSGNIDKAVELMKTANMTPGEMRARIRFGIDPGNSITPAKLRTFMYHADDDSRARMMQMLQNPDADENTEEPPP